MVNLKREFYPAYRLLVILYSFFIVFAFLVDSPMEIVQGLKNIFTSSDILITDYMAIGGIGATLVNVALTAGFCLFILITNRVKPNGSTIMAIWLVTGFSFLGKNLFNIMPVILGVYLFSKSQKEQFRSYILVALLSTSLAPVVSQLSFGGQVPFGIAIILGHLLGLVLGFILAPIASYSIKVHNGYNLYNIGFASGLVATLLMSFFRGFGINFEERLMWHTGDDGVLLLFLGIIATFLIVYGFLSENKKLDRYLEINKQSGRLISDFYILFGNAIYINMGILCIMGVGVVLLLGSDLNGATICGIFTIMGFGSFGKTIKNTIPVIIGAILAGLFTEKGVIAPSMVLAILFSTCLAPIAGKFGIWMGILAGIVHVNIVSNIGVIHGGLNLYNNGLAGGFVVMILLPLITTFKKESNI
ncbi:MAG: DUF1576 domain-containing protein [Sarcina sp.]